MISYEYTIFCILDFKGGILFMKFLVIFFAGALGSFLANRGIAVFNDAVRPVVPEFREGRMSRLEFATTTFGLSFGLVIGFGIPYSLLYSIVLVHSLWLGTDIIGTLFPAKNVDDWYKDKESLFGAIGAAVSGGVYGVALLAGLNGLNAFFQSLPVNVFDAWMGISDPITYAFIAFPVVAICIDYGWAKAICSGLLVILIRQLFIKMGNGYEDAITMFTGIVLLICFAINDKSQEKTDMASLFTDRIANIRKNLGWIAAMGAVYGLSCNIGLLMEGPTSLGQVAAGDTQNAVATTIARALSFIPLKGLTSLTTGTFVTDGFGFTATVGLLAKNPLLAALLGAVVMSLEALSLVLIAKLFDNFPGIKRSADSMRVAMTTLLDIALLAGSMIAAGNMAGPLGYLVVSAFYAMNKYFKQPITDLAVGPIATIIVAVMVNLFAVIGL